MRDVTENFRYTIDKLNLLSKKEGADDMYIELLESFSKNLPKRIVNKLIPIMVDTKKTYIERVYREIFANKVETEFDEQIKEQNNDDSILSKS